MRFSQRSAVARQAYDCWQVLGVQMASFDGFFRGGKASQPSARKALAITAAPAAHRKTRYTSD